MPRAACFLARLLVRGAGAGEGPYFTHGPGQWRAKPYYVGRGGNFNAIMGFRRYVGGAELHRPLPQPDLRDPAVLLRASIRQTIRLVALGPSIQDYAVRIARSHLQIRDFRVWRIAAK